MTVLPFKYQEEVDLNKIRVPLDKYQRNSQTDKKTSRISSNWSWQQYDPIKLRDLQDGTYDCFDGGHRYFAAKDAGLESLPSIIFNTISDDEASKSFETHDKNRTNLTPLDRFKAKEFRGEEQALMIRDILNKYGVNLTHSKGKNNTQAVSAIEGAISKSNVNPRSHLELIFSNINEIWDNDQDALTSKFIGGFSNFLNGYGSKIDSTIQRSRSASFHNTHPKDNLAKHSPHSLVRDAETRFGKANQANIAEAIFRASGIKRNSKENQCSWEIV